MQHFRTYVVFTWKQQDSNLRPSTRQADALPAELCFQRIYYIISGRIYKHKIVLKQLKKNLKKMEHCHAILSSLQKAI